MRITIKNGGRAFDIAGKRNEVLDTIEELGGLTSIVEDIADVSEGSEPQEFVAVEGLHPVYDVGSDAMFQTAQDVLSEGVSLVSWSEPSVITSYDAEPEEAFDTHGYKVGDRVVVLEDLDSGELKAGEVLFVRNIDDGRYGLPLEAARRIDAEYSDEDYFVLNFEEVEPLVFRKGDTVIIVGPCVDDDYDFLGRSGTITQSIMADDDWQEGPDCDGDYRVEDPQNAPCAFGYFKPSSLKLYRRAPVAAPEVIVAAAKFAEGDKAVVTGDTAVWWHHFKAGTVVTILDVEGSSFDCEAADGRTFYVHADDLKAYEEPAKALPALVIPGEHVRAFRDWAGNLDANQARAAGVDPEANYKLWDAVDDHVDVSGDVDFPLFSTEEALVVTGLLGTETTRSDHGKVYMPVFYALKARGIVTYEERHSALAGLRPLLGAGQSA